MEPEGVLVEVEVGVVEVGEVEAEVVGDHEGDGEAAQGIDGGGSCGGCGVEVHGGRVTDVVGVGVLGCGGIGWRLPRRFAPRNDEG